MVAEQIRFALQNALETGLRDQTVNPNDPGQLRALMTNAVRDNEELQAVVQSVNLYSLTVFDINIGDSHSITLLSTDPEYEDKPMPVRPDYKQLLEISSLQLMRTVFGPPRVYDVIVPLDNNGAPFATVHVGVRTTLLLAFYAPWRSQALTLMGVALLTALLAALLLSNLALQPMEQISRQLDRWTAEGGTANEPKVAPDQDTAAQVSTKIERIGQRMRNVEEVFSALTENLDQILGNLQDGILLFTGDGRAVLVSEAARRFLEIPRESILGLHAHDIFDTSTALGRILSEAFDAGATLVKEEIRTETGRRIQASLEFIHDEDTQQGLGALVMLHDLESVEAIESELELSRRMAAIGRLTSGVGHEVKNPINAIVVHLELLRNKLDSSDAKALRHLEIIESEIQRLDRVVQTLVDFSRPVELRLQESDLRSVVSSVLMLASADLETRDVRVASLLPDRPVMVKVDSDLLRQALLNVVLNGAQSMSQGGQIEVRLVEDGRTAMLSVRDQGEGIPKELLEKIFDLYFTTKKDGSGIGLAMTYRIIQLHNGQVDVDSVPGEGTTFTLRIPLSNPPDARLRGQLAAAAAPLEEPRG